MREERGFSLVEIIVAVTILAGSFLALGRATIGGLAGLQSVDQRAAFAEIANAEMESLRARPFSTLPVSPTPVVATGTREAPVAYTVATTITWSTIAGTNQAKALVVDVRWTERGAAAHVEVRSLRYPGGLGGTAANQAPTVTITDATPASGSAPLTVSFTGTGTDTDGTIASYAWQFGDGATGIGTSVTHVYTAAGTYSAVLVVTDDKGATAVDSRTVAVAVPNQPPVARFTFTKTFLTVSVDATTSTDPEGEALTYDWDWGDGTLPHGSGAMATHTYAGSVTKTITLLVGDPGGLTGSTSQSVTVAANQAPMASFTISANNGTVTVNGSGSTDPEGGALTYEWNWGDATTDGSGVTTTHDYWNSVTNKSVMLTVTDPGGLTATTTRTITAAAPCRVRAADFTNNGGAANTILLKSASQAYAKSSSFTLTATTNLTCASPTFGLQQSNGNWTSTVLNLVTSDSVNKTWSRPATFGTSYLWYRYPTLGSRRVQQSGTTVFTGSYTAS